MGEQGDRALPGVGGTLWGMGAKRREAGDGQLDVILDGELGVDESVILDRLVGVAVVHRCECCGRKISAEESRAYGIGYECAAELGRKVWAARRAEAREEEIRERDRIAGEAAAMNVVGVSRAEQYAMGWVEDPGVE